MTGDSVQQVVRHEMRDPCVSDQPSEWTGHVGLGHGTTAASTREYPFRIERELLDFFNDRKHGRRERHPVRPLCFCQLGRDVPPALSAVEIRPTHARDL